MPKKISINFEVNAEESGKRIDVIVSKRHPEFSRMQIKKFIELDFLSIDNQTISKVSEKASIGSKINLSGLIDAEVEDLPEDIEIDFGLPNWKASYGKNKTISYRKRKRSNY